MSLEEIVSNKFRLGSANLLNCRGEEGIFLQGALPMPSKKKHPPSPISGERACVSDLVKWWWEIGLILRFVLRLE